MNWFGIKHGAVSDVKLTMLAKKIGVRRCEMTAVWLELMDCASQNVTRGHVTNRDMDLIAYNQDIELEIVQKIYAALTEKGVIINEQFTTWEKHQPQGSDPTGALRKRRQRERERLGKEQQKLNLPDKNSDEMSRCHVTSRDCHADKNRIDIKEKYIKKENEEFEKFWEDYGKIGSKEKARKAFEKIKVEPVELSKGLQRYRAYCANNEWYQPQDASTWLENKGWEDDRPTRMQEKSDENQLTSEELRIAHLGHAAWRRRMKLQLNVEQAKFLEAYEDKNGNVWWDNLRQYKEKKR